MHIVREQKRMGDANARIFFQLDRGIGMWKLESLSKDKQLIQFIYC